MIVLNLTQIQLERYRGLCAVAYPYLEMDGTPVGMGMGVIAADMLSEILYNNRNKWYHIPDVMSILGMNWVTSTQFVSSVLDRNRPTDQIVRCQRVSRELYDLGLEKIIRIRTGTPTWADPYQEDLLSEKSNQKGMFPEDVWKGLHYLHGDTTFTVPAFMKCRFVGKMVKDIFYVPFGQHFVEELERRNPSYEYGNVYREDYHYQWLQGHAYQTLKHLIRDFPRMVTMGYQLGDYKKFKADWYRTSLVRLVGRVFA